MREGFVPAGSVLARWTEGPALFEGFYQYGFEPNVLPGCGRFDSLADYVADGCDRVYVGAMSDRLAQQTGLFARRAPDVELGPFDQQLFEAEVPERARRQCRQHLRQPQRRPPLRPCRWTGLGLCGPIGALSPLSALRC